MFITGHSGQRLLSVNASHVVFDSPPNLGTLMSTRLTTNAVSCREVANVVLTSTLSLISSWGETTVLIVKVIENFNLLA